MLRFVSRFPVPLLVVGALAVVEGGLRYSEARLSGDVAQIAEAPRQVHYAARNSGAGVLMLGNSLLAEGVDRGELERALEAKLGREVSVAKVTPDGTTPLEWRYLFRKLVIRTGEKPSVLVLAFGPGHLWDRPGASQVLRLAAHHVAAGDVGMLFNEELTDIESRAEFLTARVWRSYALKDRIQLRLLDLVLPHFRTVRASLLRRHGSESGSHRDVTDLRNLRGLLEDAAGAGIPVVLLPMPAPTLWPVEGPVETLARDLSVPILDVREEVSLEPERFPDGEHLDSLGRAAFTGALGPALARTLRPLLVGFQDPWGASGSSQRGSPGGKTRFRPPAALARGSPGFGRKVTQFTGFPVRPWRTDAGAESIRKQALNHFTIRRSRRS
jgi:hypothetical protein